MNKKIILLNLLLVLFVINGLVWQKEQILASGQLILLPLAPVDPRSLMQGDYMILRYSMARKVDNERGTEDNGKVVITINDKDVASFNRLWNGENLQKGEHLLRYRYRNHKVRFGAESFFFQEGKRPLFDKARYGELRLAKDGDAVLVGLRDEKLQKLGE